MPPEKLILTNKQSLGDIVMLTAALRDLHRTYPDRFLTDVKTSCHDLWQNNPYVTPFAIGLAILFGARPIALVPFDMQEVAGQRHFFDDDPASLRNICDYLSRGRVFAQTATHLEPDVEIVRVTSASAIRCWPRMAINQAVGERVVT